MRYSTKQTHNQNREKLITIFPYILGILNDRLLSLKEELKELQTQAKLLKKEIEQRKNIANTWLSEVKKLLCNSL